MVYCYWNWLEICKWAGNELMNMRRTFRPCRLSPPKSATGFFWPLKSTNKGLMGSTVTTILWTYLSESVCVLRIERKDDDCFFLLLIFLELFIFACHAVSQNQLGTPLSLLQQSNCFKWVSGKFLHVLLDANLFKLTDNCIIEPSYQMYLLINI